MSRRRGFGYRPPDRAAQKERADAAAHLERERLQHDADAAGLAVQVRKTTDEQPSWRARTPPGYDPDHVEHQRLEQRRRQPPNPAHLAIFAEELGLEAEVAYCLAHFLQAAQDAPRQYRGPPGFRRLVLSSLDPLDVLGIARPKPPTLTAGPSAEPTNWERLEASRRIQHAVEVLIGKDLMRADDRGFVWVYVGAGDL
jgi:hypothetical protein